MSLRSPGERLFEARLLKLIFAPFANMLHYRVMTHSLDTDPHVDALRLKLLASLEPQERFERMNRLCAFGRLAMLEGLREKHPELDEQALLILLARNLWGERFAAHIRTKFSTNG